MECHKRQPRCAAVQVDLAQPELDPACFREQLLRKRQNRGNGQHEKRKLEEHPELGAVQQGIHQNGSADGIQPEGSCEAGEGKQIALAHAQPGEAGNHPDHHIEAAENKPDPLFFDEAESQVRTRSQKRRLQQPDILPFGKNPDGQKLAMGIIRQGYHSWRSADVMGMDSLHFAMAEQQLPVQIHLEQLAGLHQQGGIKAGILGKPCPQPQNLPSLPSGRIEETACTLPQAVFR
ncbi:hypothetical protein D3C75_859880 [compost metagenome]